jgi:uncharacterized membrane protein YoaK (UPF0700 family)
VKGGQLIIQQSIFHKCRSENTISHGILLLLAGGINAAGFLYCARFVTHVTGAFTQIGLSLSQFDLISALDAFLIPLFFFLGVVVGSYLIEKSGSSQRDVQFHKVMSLIGICLFTVGVGGHFNWLGFIAQLFGITEGHISAPLLSFSSGLLNGVITVLSSATMRLTHVTGLLTDFGLSAARLTLKGREKNSERDVFKKRAGYLMTFVVGSILGSVLFLVLGKLCFIILSGLAFLMLRVTHLSPGLIVNYSYDQSSVRINRSAR